MKTQVIESDQTILAMYFDSIKEQEKEIIELRKENKKLSADLYTLACIIHEEFLSCGNSFVSSDSYYWFHQAFDVEKSGDSQFAEIMLNLIKKNDPSKKD